MSSSLAIGQIVAGLRGTHGLTKVLRRTVTNAGESQEDKTLSESDLANILQKVIKEQDDKPYRDPSTLTQLRADMEDEGIMASLRDRHTPLEERTQLLVEKLRLCFSAMQTEYPSVFPKSGRINSMIKAARLNDRGRNCDASLEFGLRFRCSSSAYFGAMFHELTHDALWFPYNLTSGNLDTCSIHEWTCDLGALAMFCKAAGGNKALLNRWIDSYTKFSKYKKEASSFSRREKPYEEHSASRGSLAKLIQEARDNNIDLSFLIHTLFVTSIDVLKTWGFYSNDLTFQKFAEELAPRASQSLLHGGYKGVGFTLEPATLCPTSRIVTLLENLSDKIFGEGISVPRMTIRRTSTPVHRISLKDALPKSAYAY